jgi:hypothetical protein
MTNLPQIFTGLLFDAHVEIHQVRRLVFDNYRMCTFPLTMKSTSDALPWAHVGQQAPSAVTWSSHSKRSHDWRTQVSNPAVHRQVSHGLLTGFHESPSWCTSPNWSVQGSSAICSKRKQFKAYRWSLVNNLRLSVFYLYTNGRHLMVSPGPVEKIDRHTTCMGFEPTIPKTYNYNNLGG